MATLTPGIKIEDPRISRGGGGRGPFDHFGGGDDGSRGDLPDFGRQLRRYRLGMAVGLASVIMLFVSLTSAYIVRQGVGQWDEGSRMYVTDWKPIHLPTVLLVVNTLVLLLSTLTIEKARRSALQEAAVAPIAAMPGIAAGPRPLPWLPITLVLGLGFLCGQVLVWQQLAHLGAYMSGNPSNSFFYLLTGTHAIHLLGGILALAYALATSLMWRPLERRRIVVDVTAWYWHFLTLLWLYIYALLVFAV